MRYFSWIILAAIVSTGTAGRWRFAFPFPGKVEPSLPEPVHKPYDDLVDKEKVFDTKQAARRVKNNKIALEEKEDDDGKLESQGRRMPWML
jgi:hypothetical protein